MRKKEKKNKGITLIALVITIIVLLILAGVSIATLLGENGILTQANKASYETKLAELKENLQLDILDVTMGKNGSSLSEEELRKVLVKYFGEKNVPAINDSKWDNFPEGFELTTEDGKYTVNIADIYNADLGKMTAGTETTKPEGAEWENTVTPVADGEGHIIPVPNGFSYKEGTKETGFVIQDDEGNEFVWVPCGKGEEITYEKEKGLAVTWTNAQEDDVEYKTKQLQYTEYDDWTDTYGDTVSVNKYGGFYIGRYEAGIPSTASFYETADNGNYLRTTSLNSGRDVTEENGKTLKPVSRKNNPSWNDITQEHAREVSGKMYEGSESVTSQLIDSYAWDTVVEWIKTGEGKVEKATNSSTNGNYYNNTNISLEDDGIYAMHAFGSNWLYTTIYSVGNWKRTESNKKITKDNIGTEYSKYQWVPPHSEWDFETKTYYERIEIATGAAESTKTKNIYDLAGNMLEWTTETGKHKTTNETYAVMRGGGFGDHGSVCPICYRNGSNKDNSNYSFSIGFRVVLYVK